MSSSIAFAASLQNPLQDQGVVDYLFFFIKAVMTSAIPFLILAFIVAGLYFILARGKPSGLEGARNFFFKLLLYASLLLGATFIFKLVLNLIFTLFDSLRAL